MRESNSIYSNNETGTTNPVDELLDRVKMPCGDNPVQSEYVEDAEQWKNRIDTARRKSVLLDLLLNYFFHDSFND